MAAAGTGCGLWVVGGGGGGVAALGAGGGGGVRDLCMAEAAPRLPAAVSEASIDGWNGNGNIGLAAAGEDPEDTWWRNHNDS